MSIESKAYEQVKTSRTAWERACLMVPGYRGYRTRDLIRGTDQLVRDVVARQLKQGLGALKDTYKAVVNQGEAGFAEGIDSGVRTLDRLHQSVLHAPGGFTGRWDPAKILDKELDRAVEFDAGLLDMAQTIAAASDAVRANPGPALLQDLRGQLERFDRTFTGRRQFLLGLYETGAQAGKS
jgi:hypothetical protein